MSIKNTSIFDLLSNVLLFCTGFSIAFNTLEIKSISVSYVLLFTLLYTVSILPRVSLRAIKKTYGKGALGFLLFFLYLIIINSVVSLFYDNRGKIPIVNPSILLNVLFFYSVLIHSIKNEIAPKIALYGFTIGTFCLSIFFLEGSQVALDIKSARLTIFELNPNDLGIYMSMASIVIYSELLLQDKLRFRLGRVVFLVPVFMMIAVMFATGSRTAFLIFVLSFLLSIIIHKSSSKKIRFLFVLASIVVAIVAYSAIKNGDYVVVERLMDSSDDDKTSGRVQIWGALLPYITSNPIFGYGEIGYYDISGPALATIQNHNYGAGYSPHNVFVEVAIYTGLIGLFLMFIFWRSVVKNAFSQYKHLKSITTILLFIPLFFALVSGQALVPRHYYLIYLMALIPSINKNKKKYYEISK